MNHVRLCQWVLVLSLLLVSVVVPLAFLSSRLGEKEFVNDLPSIRQSADALILKSIEQDEDKEVKEPISLVLKELKESVSLGSVATKSLSSEGKVDGLHADGGRARVQLQNGSVSTGTVEQNKGSRTAGRESRGHSKHHQAATYEKIKEIKDHLIMAKAYLHFTSPNSNSHMARELKLRIKEMDQVIGHANKDSVLSRSALQRKKAMENTLNKARSVYPDCGAMATKLRSMAYNTEEQLRAQKSQASYLIQLAARTFPKGLHCLSMRLTGEYFVLKPEERELTNTVNVKKQGFYHYAIFSDNVLACAVVVNSTISTSKDAQKIVFHVVTDSLNYPAMKMWFLLNPSGQATIHVENMEDFNWLPSTYRSVVRQLGVKDLRFSSLLNHLRFYLPHIFPYLDKVLLLDHDVVVQRDLSDLWKTKMGGKVNGAVETCRNGKPLSRLEVLVDFSDPTVSRHFNPKACVWAFGMNMFDLQQWRRQGLTAVYQKWLNLFLAKKQPLLRAGSLPLGQLTFYNQTLALDRRWHVLGLGCDLDVSRNEIEKAAVIHYDGNMKPWLEIGIPKYREHWNRFLNYDNRYMQQCNIHK